MEIKTRSERTFKKDKRYKKRNIMDISMCKGINCNIKDNCYRFKAKPSEFRQSWFWGSPNIDVLNCDYYWEVTKPIHKFNNGNGATLCHRCSKIINTGFTKDLYCSDKCKNK